MHENPFSLSRTATLRKRHGDDKNASIQLHVVKAPKVLLKRKKILNLVKVTATITEWGTVVAQWLRCCATNRKVACSIPDGVIGIFH